MGIQIRYEHGPTQDEANVYDVGDFKELLDEVDSGYHERFSALSAQAVGDVLATAYFSANSDALNDTYQHALFSAYLEDLRGTDRQALPYIFGVRAKEIARIHRVMPGLVARAVHPLLRYERTVATGTDTHASVEELDQEAAPNDYTPHLHVVPDITEESAASTPASVVDSVDIIPVSVSQEYDNIPRLSAEEYISHGLEQQKHKGWQSSAKLFFAGELAAELKDGQASALAAHIFDGADRSKKANFALGELRKWHAVVRSAGIHLERLVLNDHQAVRFDDLVKSLTNPTDSRKSSVVEIVRRKMEQSPASRSMDDDTAKCLTVGLIASLYEHYKLVSGDDEQAS